MNLLDKPLVSVLMATYNRSQILAQTIENILLQDYRPVELIIVNDGSSDDTQKVLASFKSNPNVMIINNQQNLGLQRSLNKGIRSATGKYIARIDDHDRWIEKDKLSKQVAYMEAHPDVGLLGTGYVKGHNKVLNPGSDLQIRKQILFRCPFCHVTVMMRKSILAAVGGYDENLPYSEDWDLWLRIGKYSKMANLPDVTTEVAEEEGSLTNRYFLKQLSINRSIVRKHLNNYPKRTRAWFYHLFIKYFFTIIPSNGNIHRVMKKVFQLTFMKPQ